ncbi:hypothetical protein F5Y15DRAFT_341347 [Xylariaceae sp. FL0016]|nr:hypothetical protein F5Y15DRAFT_341347 [Xylariaceae sp. FL0016]
MSLVSSTESNNDPSAQAMKTIVDEVRMEIEGVYLEDYKKNEAYALQMPNDTPISRKLRAQSLRLLVTDWQNFIDTLQRDLPQTIKAILSGLRDEIRIENDQLNSPPIQTPLTPPTVSRELPAPTVPHRSSDLCRTTIPNVYIDRSNTMGRSVSPPSIDEKGRTDAHQPSSPIKKATEAGSLLARKGPEARNKRSCDDGESPNLAKKRAKRSGPSWRSETYNKNSLSECKQDECIFKGKDNKYYVIRCTRLSCKDQRVPGVPFIYFQSHPFREGLAMRHFRGKGHGIPTEDEVFNKYSKEVYDAKQEHNVQEGDGQGVSGVGSGENTVAPPADRPVTASKKGKQTAHSSTLSRTSDTENRPTTPSHKTLTKPTAFASISDASPTPRQQKVARNTSSPHPDSSLKARSRVEVIDDSDQSLFVDDDDDSDNVSILSLDEAVKTPGKNVVTAGEGVKTKARCSRAQGNRPDYKEKPATDKETREWEEAHRRLY